MNNTISENDFLQMKEQLQSLKAQLDAQTTLHEEKLSKTLHHSANQFKRRERSSFFFVALALILGPCLYVEGFSLLFCGLTTVFFLFAFVWEVVMYKRLQVGHILDSDLLKAQTNLQKYMAQSRFWLFRIGLPFICVWFPWYVYEYLQEMNGKGVISTGDTKLVIVIVCALLIGGIIGGCVGYFTFYRPQMRLAEKMLEDINELKKE